MSYLILTGLVVLISFFYEYIRGIEQTKKSVKIIVLALLCLVLCGFAGLRTKYNDTGNYILSFLETPRQISTIFKGEFSLGGVYLFELWNYVIFHFISSNPNVWLFLCSMVFVLPTVYLIAKYAKGFTLSMFLLMIVGGYLFSLAGLKQAMATGIVMMGIPALINKKYFKYYIFCFIAMSFHTYSLIYLILPLIGREVFNKRTIIFCVAMLILGVGLSFFADTVSSLVEILGKDVDEETITSGSVNILRALVYAVPFVLAVLGRNKIKEGCTEVDKRFIKIALMSSVFMILAIFGNPILFGRVPHYFGIGVVVSLPILIDGVFKGKDARVVTVIAIVLYFGFGLYQLYNDGAFMKDIFGLLWF
ncbi:MAG: EpsG family protein [Clostridia bacterium]|nr:EpsG family protein [Clostridia bacterium]